MQIFISELIGTFILMIAILVTKNPVFIAAAFLGAITIASVSGGHVSPIVSLVMYMKGAVPDMATFLEYIIGQSAGAFGALAVSKILL